MKINTFVFLGITIILIVLGLVSSKPFLPNTVLKTTENSNCSEFHENCETDDDCCMLMECEAYMQSNEKI